MLSLMHVEISRTGKFHGSSHACVLLLRYKWSNVPSGSQFYMPPTHQLVDLSFARVVHELRGLAAQFPALAAAWTTQQRYNLPSAGACPNSDGSSSACNVWVLELTHRASLGRNPRRPDVLISGALHGDERVGPLATLELAKWLLGHYETDDWARRLVHTRRLLLVPMANAVGYAGRSRNELRNDPNRDFPFQQSPTSCMTTIAARSINELFRGHLIQLASEQTHAHTTHMRAVLAHAHTHGCRPRW